MVRYAAVKNRPGYRVGTDGSLWSKRAPGRWGRELKRWRRIAEKPAKSGYCEVTFRNPRRLVRVHVLVLNAFVGPCPAGCEARHLDDDKSNNHLDNLCWGTRKQNHDDRRRNGILVNGSALPQAILSESIVADMRQRAAGGETVKALALEIGVAQYTLGDAVAGRNWKHVKTPPVRRVKRAH